MAEVDRGKNNSSEASAKYVVTNAPTTPTDVTGLVNAAKAQRRSKICLISFISLLGVIIFAVVLTGGLLFVKDNYNQISGLKFDPKAGRLIMRNSRGIEALWGSLGESFRHLLYKEKLRSNSMFYEWENTVTLRISKDTDRCFVLKWNAGESDVSTFTDCYELKASHWYGGAEMFRQVWPLEKADVGMKPFLPMDYLKARNETESAYGSVLERYWLNSKGIAVLVNESVPLHVSWNQTGDRRFCLKADRQGYPASPVPHQITYRLCSGANAKDIHVHVMQRYLQLPVSMPDERMIKQPIWSTWARYKKAVNQSTVLEYAKQIQLYGFPHSQIEIDDCYSTNYGDFDFNPIKFSDPRFMIDQLHKTGFRVTVWVHPFANLGSKAFQMGMKYWVKQKEGDVIGIVKWWNGMGTALDMTSRRAQMWFAGRLKTFRNTYDIDSFNFDAGELTYLPNGYRLTYIQNFNPAYYSTSYARVAAMFGSMILARVGYQTQKLSKFVRMLDRDSNWGENNGLRSLIPTVLTFGILGYPFVLPAMVGGNVHCNDDIQCTAKPEKELYIRWLQATVFLPSLQFSITPWDYDNETVNIARKMMSLRTSISDVLVKFAKGVNESGAAVIQPLWWMAPDDTTAQVMDSEFLVGDTYLVAPVLVPMEQNKGSHKVYLPRGKWREDFRSKRVVEVQEGKWFEYVVTLEDLPYFTYVSDVDQT